MCIYICVCVCVFVKLAVVLGGTLPPHPPPSPMPFLDLETLRPEQAAAVRYDWQISGNVSVIGVSNMSRDRGRNINGGKHTSAEVCQPLGSSNIQ